MKSQVIIISPLVKNFKSLQVWSLYFQDCQKWSMGLKFWKISIIVLVLFNFGRNGPWMKSFEGITYLVPEVSQIGRNGPWEIQK